MQVSLDEVRARVQELMRTQPAETSPELSWLVQEMERQKTILMDIVDHLILEQQQYQDEQREFTGQEAGPREA